jgi:CHASE3 domain sensor protein
MNSTHSSLKFLNLLKFNLLLFVNFVLLVITAPLFAQNNLVGISEREIAKRQQAIKQAEKLVGNAKNCTFVSKREFPISTA